MFPWTNTAYHGRFIWLLSILASMVRSSFGSDDSSWKCLSFDSSDPTAATEEEKILLALELAGLGGMRSGAATTATVTSTAAYSSSYDIEDYDEDEDYGVGSPIPGDVFASSTGFENIYLSDGWANTESNNEIRPFRKSLLNEDSHQSWSTHRGRMKSERGAKHTKDSFAPRHRTSIREEQTEPKAQKTAPKPFLITFPTDCYLPIFRKTTSSMRILASSRITLLHAPTSAQTTNRQQQQQQHAQQKSTKHSAAGNRSSYSPPPPVITPWVRRFLAKCHKDVLLPIPRDFLVDNFNLVLLPEILSLDTATFRRAWKCIVSTKEEGKNDEDRDDDDTAIAARNIFLHLHQRFILSHRGLDMVRRRLLVAPIFGRCPSPSCHGTPLLPIGTSCYNRSDDAGEESSCPAMAQRYCWTCRRAWMHWDSVVPGWAWGDSFCHLFILEHGSEVFGQEIQPSFKTAKVTGIQMDQLVEPQIFGFRLHPSAKYVW